MLYYNKFCTAKLCKLNNWYESGKEKYSSGWRGAPAKGIGRLRGARVQIPPSPVKKNLLMILFFCKLLIAIVNKV